MSLNPGIHQSLLSLRSVSITLGTIVAVSCVGFDGPIFETRVRMRALNAATYDATILVDGVSKATLPFGASSGCIELRGDSPDVAVRRSTGSSVFPYMSGFSDTSITFLTTGNSTFLQFLALPNSFTAPSGQAGIRVINAVNAGTYDIYFTAPGQPLGTPMFSGLEGQVLRDFVAGPIGTWEVKVTTAGTQAVVADLGLVVVGMGNITIVLGPPATGTTNIRALFLTSAEDC